MGWGTLAVQFAKLRGARVLATVSGADEIAFVKDLGADAVVDGRHADIAAAAATSLPRRALMRYSHAIAGGQALEHCIDALKPGGRVAYPTGVQPPPKARDGLSVVRYDATPGPQQFARLNAAIASMKFKVPIAARFPLTQAAAAQERIEAGHVPGKIVLEVRAP